MQKGYFNNVTVNQVRDYQAKMEDFLSTRKESLLMSLANKKAFDESIESELSAALDEFKAVIV